MGTCIEVSVQAAQIGCLGADFREHVRPADIELRVIPSRSAAAKPVLACPRRPHQRIRASRIEAKAKTVAEF